MQSFDNFIRWQSFDNFIRCNHLITSNEILHHIKKLNILISCSLFWFDRIPNQMLSKNHLHGASLSTRVGVRTFSHQSMCLNKISEQSEGIICVDALNAQGKENPNTQKKIDLFNPFMIGVLVTSTFLFTTTVSHTEQIETKEKSKARVVNNHGSPQMKNDLLANKDSALPH